MSRPATELLKRLQDHDLRFFTTADVITLARQSPAAATHALRRLASQGLLVALKRGVWAVRFVESLDPMEAVPHLTSPWPGYVSLYSALSRYGLIEEVPHLIYAVSTVRTRRYQTPLGEFRIHHLPKELIWGFREEHSGRGSFPVAEPEKAFLDLAYLGLIPRSPLGLPYKRDHRWKLDLAKLKRYARRFQFPPLIRYLRQNKLW